MEERKDILLVRPRELERYQIICKALDRYITQKEASGFLGVSERHVRRIIKRVKIEGERGVIHKSRGKPGRHRIAGRLKTRILGLYKAHYPDFGPTLASEKLLERHKIAVNDETLRLWLIQENLWESKKQKKKNTRTWRPRKDHFGEMSQMDGSHHDWLEQRGPKLVLMGHIDDATNKFYGYFADYEGTYPAMESLKRYILRHDIPRAIYLDKHSTYKNNKNETYKDWPFRDKEELTQFGRACKELGIHLIHAHSPQAKGRIERVFETLQDRLVKELRLAGARTRAQANKVLLEYLEIFNKKFEVAPKRKGDLHRPPDNAIDLDGILSVQTEHTLRQDRTVIHHKRWYQVLDKTHAKKVVVHEYADGKIGLKSRERELAYKPIEGPKPRITNPKPLKTRLLSRSKIRYSPPAGSYWRESIKRFFKKKVKLK